MITAGEISFDKPFTEQLEFFRQKGYVFSPDSWMDVWQGAHAQAFTVARVTQMDVLFDVRNALDQAMANGTTLKKFKDDLVPELEKKGWFAPVREPAIVELPDGTKRKRLTGWRLDTIYGTNMSASYAVGRYKQLQELVEMRPFWQYMAIRDGSTRPAHLANHGKVYRHDHPFWDEWYPPNGFNCRCYVKSLDAEDMAERNLTPETDIPKDVAGDPVHPDLGWEFNPGKAGIDAWQPKLRDYPAELVAQYQAGLAQAKAAAASAAKAAAQAAAKVARAPKPLGVKTRADAEKIIATNVAKFLKNSGQKLQAIKWRDKDAFMSTDCKGSFTMSTRTHQNVPIWDPASKKRVKRSINMSDEFMSAMQSIGVRPLTFTEEYSLESFWHEVLHNRQILSIKSAMSPIQVRMMETVNQYLARRTYPKFLQALGNYKPSYLNEVKKHGLGYQNTLDRFEKIMSKLNLVEKDVAQGIADIHKNEAMGDYTQKLVALFQTKSGRTKLKDKWLIKAAFDAIMDATVDFDLALGRL